MAGGHEEVGINEDAEHTEAFVEFDEAHAAHVCGEVVNLVAAVGGLDAGVFEFEVEGEVLGFGEALIPLPLGFFIDGADAVSRGEEVLDEFAADESAGAGYEGWVVLHGGVLSFTG